MRRSLYLGVLFLITLSGAPELGRADESYGGHHEKYWRKAFERVRAGLDAVTSCRARLPDYCSWEYWESRGETEARAYKEYLEAKRRGEDVEDPLAKKIYVPEPCQELFRSYPDDMKVEADPEAPHSCPARLAVLTEAIDTVERYWREQHEQLETEAQHDAVPRHWRN